MSIERKLDVSPPIKSAALRKAAVQEILNQMEVITEEDFNEIIEKATFTGKFDANLIKCYDSFKNEIAKQKISPIVIIEDYPKRWPGGIINGIPAPDFVHVRFADKVFALNASQTGLLEKTLNIRLQTANKITL